MAKKAKWRRHTLEFKRQVVERMKVCQNIHELARELKIERKLLYTWKYQFEGRPEPRHANLGIPAEDRKEKQHREEIAKLKAALADKTLENDFFRSALLKVKEGRQWSTETGASASNVIRSRAQEQGRLGVERMCHLAVVSRASYYRHWEEVAPDEAEMAARVSIQEVVLRHRRRYGYRRVTADLHRQGMVINHKRVARIPKGRTGLRHARRQPAGDSLPQVHSHDGFQA